MGSHPELGHQLSEKYQLQVQSGEGGVSTRTGRPFVPRAVWSELLAFLLVPCQVCRTEAKSTHRTEQKGAQLSYTARRACRAHHHLRVPKACRLHTSDAWLFVGRKGKENPDTQ